MCAGWLTLAGGRNVHLIKRDLIDWLCKNVALHHLFIVSLSLQCNTGGRNEEESLYVDIIHDIEQMGNNPLLILEGIT